MVGTEPHLKTNRIDAVFHTRRYKQDEKLLKTKPYTYCASSA
jgi:hypothetical protein